MDRNLLEKRLSEREQERGAGAGEQKQTQRQTQSQPQPHRGGGGSDSNNSSSGSGSSSPGGGMVASVALQCICHAEIQLSRVWSNTPSSSSAPSSSSSEASAAELLRASGAEEPFQFDYEPFFRRRRRWPAPVRASALDAMVLKLFLFCSVVTSFFRVTSLPPRD